MAKLNINNIENVEGKYHLMFFEGKNMVESAKNDLRFTWFSLLFFVCLFLVFVIFTSFNMFYVGFFAVFFVCFLVNFICLKMQKRRGTKQCIYAVQNSKTTEIVNKQIDNRSASKAIVKSMSNTIDKYDAKAKYKGFVQKYKRRKKHKHIVGIIMDFEEEKEKKV
ncbi:MAG: hypothetical protein J6J24_01640 [Clostridia bacterium]|nr:hypothetical protein [Clostridia bacterium]